MNENERYQVVRGTPFEVGYQMGQAVGGAYAEAINDYLRQGPMRYMKVTQEHLAGGAVKWVEHLPQRYQDELLGFAHGAGISFHRVAEWAFADDCGGIDACSSLIVRFADQFWVGRNNDLWVPSVWGFATHKEVAGKIPYLDIGMRASLFSATGMNAERLWMHYHFLPVVDVPGGGKPVLPPYVFSTEVIETCSNIVEVDRLLARYDRSSGMILFVIDGKNQEAAIFECSRTLHQQIPVEEMVFRANHAEKLPLDVLGEVSAGSLTRFERMRELAEQVDWTTRAASEGRQALRAILSDPAVEQHQDDYGTVYPALACPAGNEIHFTAGGYPAASRGNWQKLIPIFA